MLNLIIPMAGKGKRLLPHTLTTPKPLIPIAGKSIVERLLEEINLIYQGPIRHIGFIVKDLPTSIKSQLENMATELGAQAHFYEQSEALGTAHAIACAAPLLQGPVIVAFSDTLFKGSLPLDVSKEGVIWVNKVKNPSSFGVVQVDSDNLITDFVEKPTEFVSDLAIIGIYYLKKGEILLQAIQHIIDQQICKGGEYQLTSALTYMQQQGYQFSTQTIDEWLDCGNKEACLHTNQRFLHFLQNTKGMIANSAEIYNSTIIPPVYIGEKVILEHTVLGPYVSVGHNTHIKGSRITNSIIQEHTKIDKVILTNSMIGNHVHIKGKCTEIDTGDYNTITF
ncbi:MAG: sugar phosphate nucleotidyltransferase [Candidatus Amoebophilus sp.]